MVKAYNFPEAHPEPIQLSVTELFAKIVNGWMVSHGICYLLSQDHFLQAKSYTTFPPDIRVFIQILK